MLCDRTDMAYTTVCISERFSCYLQWKKGGFTVLMLVMGVTIRVTSWKSRKTETETDFVKIYRGGGEC